MKNKRLSCYKCNLAVIKLYNIAIPTRIRNKKTGKYTIEFKKRNICRFCKKEYLETGKLTRKKIIPNYREAEKLLHKHREAKNGN